MPGSMSSMAQIEVLADDVGLAVVGELDVDTIDRFDAALDELLAFEPKALVLDFTHLRYLGSVALSSVLRARSLVDEVRIRHRGPRVRRTFELADLVRFFVFEDEAV